MTIVQTTDSEVVKVYAEKVTIVKIEDDLRKKLYKMADKIVADMMKGIRVRTQLTKALGDSNYIITHQITFPKKGKK